MAALLTRPGATRDRLTYDTYIPPNEHEPVGAIEAALQAQLNTRDIDAKIRQFEKSGRLGADPKANVRDLAQAVFQAGGIAGPLIGGALIPVTGFALLYLIDTLALLAGFVAVVPLPSLKPMGEAVRPGFGSVIDGFAYLAGHKVLMVSFLVDIIAMVFGMPRALFVSDQDVIDGLGLEQRVVGRQDGPAR